MAHGLWRTESDRVIGNVLRDFEKAGGNRFALSADDKASLKKQIDTAYPFGFRANHPYKAWLKARKSVFISLGIIEPKPSKPVQQPDHTPGQINLF
jgi:hypothetical protein